MIDALDAQSCDRLSSRLYPCSGSKILPVPVVLIHGWGNDSRVWEPLLPCLAPGVDVIVVDLPGFGDSTPVDGWQQSLLRPSVSAKALPSGQGRPW